jgi:hypothetical protein
VIGRLSIAVAAGLVVAALTGCGGGPNTQPQVDVGPNVGNPINLANCHDWNQSDTAQRLGTLQQLKDFASGAVVGTNSSAPAGRGAVLDDKKAYDLLTEACKRQFAAGFRLYLLYQRAASFSGKPAN